MFTEPSKDKEGPCLPCCKIEDQLPCKLPCLPSKGNPQPSPAATFEVLYYYFLVLFSMPFQVFPFLNI